MRAGSCSRSNVWARCSPPARRSYSSVPEGAAFPGVFVLVAAALLMILYEIAWVRYFRDGEKLDGMYQLRGPAPVPIASLPVAAFALLGIWHKSPLAAISAIIIAVGHIGIHLGHLHERKDGSREERRRKRGGAP